MIHPMTPFFEAMVEVWKTPAFRLLSERTKAGIVLARQAGVRVGRPPVPRPFHARVAELKSQGFTWNEIASICDTSVWAVRQAAKR